MTASTLIATLLLLVDLSNAFGPPSRIDLSPRRSGSDIQPLLSKNNNILADTAATRERSGIVCSHDLYPTSNVIAARFDVLWPLFV
ncbi:hypothetical protein F5Y19DRAFT_296670 [Xylariaceae sp. FL1651]|nr:hypothetical protein F5Y19DRAFT_296670 [Xylariaceae sp. FL1651]